jgi:hypothetical protein
MTAQGADYVLALKENHPTLYDDVQLFLDDANATACSGIAHERLETVDGDHGRSETRPYWVPSAIDWRGAKASWANRQSIGRVESRRETGAEVSIATRLFITSLPCAGRWTQISF